MYWTEFITLAIAHLVAVVTPGPDFAIVLRHSVSHGRNTGLWTSVGIALGIVLHMSYCVLGVAIVFNRFPLSFKIAQLIAAAYLAFLGVKSLSTSSSAVFRAESNRQGGLISNRKALLSGFLTNGLNPKATLFFIALFTLVISEQTPLWILLSYALYLSLATLCWFALLAMVLSRVKIRQWLLQAGPWFERIMGIVFILLAIRIAIGF